MTIPDDLATLLRRQGGVVTAPQAHAAGLTRAQIRTLLAKGGWRRPMRGILVAPEPIDPFRTSVRSALLACPYGVAGGITAARLHGLWIRQAWTAAELPQVLLPAGFTHKAREGIRLRSGLLAEQHVIVDGFRATTLARTVHDLAVVLRLNDLVCLLDSALRTGWVPARDSRRRSRLDTAAALADARSESVLETLLRLLLVRAGLEPETLQHEVVGPRGAVLARLDLAWPSIRLAVEADGAAFHDAPRALYRDRRRANDLELLGWTILRFTWTDVIQHPDWVVSQVRRALEHTEMVAKRAR
jgi:REase_MTES_1575/Transcriptional regulator, AbiEi antitoxin